MPDITARSSVPAVAEAYIEGMSSHISASFSESSSTLSATYLRQSIRSQKSLNLVMAFCRYSSTSSHSLRVLEEEEEVATLPPVLLLLRFFAPFAFAPLLLAAFPTAASDCPSSTILLKLSACTKMASQLELMTCWTNSSTVPAITPPVSRQPRRNPTSLARIDSCRIVWNMPITTFKIDFKALSLPEKSQQSSSSTSTVRLDSSSRKRVINAGK
mmetsp:Transcript_29421/g.49617  ORF Transcript_29421/g.49617 Transcript_29421/m.49617 type:complete len:215 (-) Transcript_29421:499-1143(-)